MPRLPHGERKLRDDMWRKGLLWCKTCEQFLPIKKFWKWQRYRDSNYGYRYYCKHCESTKKRNKKRAKEYHKKRNYQLKKEAVELAGGQCQRCGYDKFVTALEFHHVYPALKESDPVKLLYSRKIKGAWSELDKCCLLCRNCHVAYTGNEWRAEFIKRDGLGWTVGESLPLGSRAG